MNTGFSGNYEYQAAYIMLQGPDSGSIKINGKLSTDFRSAMNHWEVLSCLISILIFTVNTHFVGF